MDRVFLGLGAVSAGLAVALGAFAAHGLRARLSAEALQTFETGARYHMYHALALLAVAWAVTRWPGTAATAAGWLFIAGILLFSGSLERASLIRDRCRCQPGVVIASRRSGSARVFRR